MNKRCSDNSKYVITAINRLTKERIVVSRPYNKEDAVRIRNDLAKRNHPHSVYSRLKVEPLDCQLKIDFGIKQ